jgi:3-dehydroshikimate dehydratase
VKDKKLMSGMVSVTFRNYSVDEVIKTVVKAGLDGIEWGGDIHVPHGDIKKAAYTAAACSEAGLKVFSYGSYYRAGQEQDFIPVIETAAALGAPNIRIWAGVKGSAESVGDYAAITEDVITCADRAAEYGMTVSFEYHGGTLTDNAESAVKLINDINKNNIYLYWQPDQHNNAQYNINALKKILPYLLHVHVFTWDKSDRYPLSKGEDMWRKYIDIIKSGGKAHGMFLEFSADNTETAFHDDARTLKSWIQIN